MIRLSPFALGTFLLAPLLLAEQPGGGMFQVSTLDALSLGVFQGSMTFSDLRRHGDFGVGTFDGLDGEMVALDGQFFRVRSDGTVSRVENSATSPFAVVTRFRAEQSAELRGPATRVQALAAFDRLMASANHPYAVKVHGLFSSLTTRSVPKQDPPYPPLAAAISQQSTFPLYNVRGTLVGFRVPAFLKGINQTGYHFHFISDDQRNGGHALEFEIGDVKVEVQKLSQHSTFFPDDTAFRDAALPLP